MDPVLPLAPMSKLPEPGQKVNWRCHRHADALGWAHAYGPGPFPVIGVVDNSQRDLPAGVVVDTQLGVREINEVWLALSQGPEQSTPNWQGYSTDILVAIDGAD